MRILVAFRRIPGRTGWSTGECLAHELRALGHDVQEHASVFGQWRPWVRMPGVADPDLIIYCECNDPDPQYSFLSKHKCPKVFWTFDESTYYERPGYAEFIDAMGFDAVAYANLGMASFWGECYERTMWLPYGVSHLCPPPDVRPQRTRGCTLLGTPFDERTKFVSVLSGMGAKVDLISGIYGEAMLHVLRESKISLHHYASGGDGLLVGRIWDTVGVGTCLLTQMQPGLAECFEPGDEVITYETAEECAYWVTRLGWDSDYREYVARQGHKRAMKEHTMRHRAEALIALAGGL